MKLLTLCLCILLVSCTSEPLNVRYYLLHTPQNTVDIKSDIAKPIVVVQSLKIADYLRQSNLVMQLGEYELHYSRQDVWAEELESSFYNALLQDLNSYGKRNYVVSSSPDATGATTIINIKLEHFHATDASTVVSSGHYWLSVDDIKVGKNKGLTTSSHSFYLESELKQDGYSHAVEKLRMLVENLANKIEKDISALPNN
ncbi:ABC-type transport auxiliary lipoprotein family protein [uncultured Paraglaciecola sp.]|uniref:PqiC family protein n=1 Tax=uncultured Paraglaciecola sp. TaxID=1765024 RepID=UPI0030D72BD3|tara:strand:+ start:182004 stop:182603 length:600 start_codon:yes stop_codon:yes gene_type:complete